MTDRTRIYATENNEIGIEHADGRRNSIVEPLRRKVPPGFAPKAAKWMDYFAGGGFGEGREYERKRLAEAVVTVDDVDVRSINGDYGVYFEGKLVITARTQRGANRLARRFHKAKLKFLAATPPEQEVTNGE